MVSNYQSKEITKGDIYFRGANEEAIVLLPGLGRTAESLSFLAKELSERFGYTCYILDHPNTRQTIQQSADFCRRKIDHYGIHNNFDKVHFIGASRGGLVIRKILKYFRPNNLGRCVLLGTPLKGSHISNHFMKHSILGFFARWEKGPSLKELQVGAEGVEKLFNSAALPQYTEWGMIAGTLPEERKNERATPLHPLKSPLPEPHDGVSSLESTKDTGLKDHVTLKGTGHIELEVDFDTINLCHEFLQTGKFTQPPENREKRLFHRPPKKLPLYVKILGFFFAPKA